jgi:hypothetical protein
VKGRDSSNTALLDSLQSLDMVWCLEERTYSTSNFLFFISPYCQSLQSRLSKVAALTSSTLSSTAVASAVRDALAENHKKYSREFEQHALSDVRKLFRGPNPSRSHSRTVVLLSYRSEFDTEPSHVYETTVRADNPSICANTQSVRADTPSIYTNTQSVRADTPSVYSNTQSVRADNPSIWANTQSVRADTPSVYSNTQSVRADTPSIYAITQSVRANTQFVRTGIASRFLQSACRSLHHPAARIQEVCGFYKDQLPGRLLSRCLTLTVTE